MQPLPCSHGKSRDTQQDNETPTSIDRLRLANPSPRKGRR
jgi:hypothetical protein